MGNIIAWVMASATTTDTTQRPSRTVEAVAGDKSGRANPDMVAVTLSCSSNLGKVEDKHLQLLLERLYQVSIIASRNTSLSVRWRSRYYVYSCTGTC